MLGDRAGSAPRKRKVSAAARRRMAIAPKKRWAAIKGEAGSQRGYSNARLHRAITA
jgi:hypothetical protein